jgi:hypothetical protein
LLCMDIHWSDQAVAVLDLAFRATIIGVLIERMGGKRLDHFVESVAAAAKSTPETLTAFSSRNHSARCISSSAACCSS